MSELPPPAARDLPLAVAVDFDDILKGLAGESVAERVSKLRSNEVA